MTFEEFAAWLREEVSEGRLSGPMFHDFLEQRELFDANRQMLESEYRNRVVGYVARTLVVADSLTLLLGNARVSHPERVLYFEPIAQ